MAASQPIATRPLATQQSGTWYTYGLDLTKNVMEVYGPTGYIATTYTYSPFGEVTATGNVEQPIQWSSEFLDKELENVYYNFRYLNPQSHRWQSRDDVNSKNLYVYCQNIPILFIDNLGNISTPQAGAAAGGYINPPTTRPQSTGMGGDYTNKLMENISEWGNSKPSDVESLIPVVGSFHEAVYAFGQGNITEGVFHSIMAITDIAIVKNLVSSGIKFTIKRGSHTWKATRRWYGKMMNLPPNTHVHHVYFGQNGAIGKYLPRWFVNQPWNLEPIFATLGKSSNYIHVNLLHHRKFQSFSDIKIYAKYQTKKYIYPILLFSNMANSARYIYCGIIEEGEEIDDIEFNANIDIEVPDNVCLPEECCK